MRAPHNQQSGFTLVEMIMVIVITGIIGGMVAVFLKAPIQQYMDVARRAEITDIADTAVRRMARDVRTAVPNSVRFTICTAPCVEFIPTKDGGRYRAGLDAGGSGDVLNFGGSDNAFDMINGVVPVSVAVNDYIVIGSTQSDGVPPYLETNAGVLRKVTNVTAPTITFTAIGLPSWAELSSQRFDVVDGTQKAVTYACVGGGVVNGDGVGKLMRYSNYGFNVAPTSVTPAILASKVDCTKTSIDYDIPNQRFGLLAIRLTLTSGGESVSLYNEIHVNNAP
jgi:MSHA biogenesis protein MshO